MCSRFAFPVMGALIASACFAPCLHAASIYFIGNSVTDSINYTSFEELATGQGKSQPWGRHIILGSPLDNIIGNPASGFQQPPFGYYPNALPNYAWDFLSLQPFDRSLVSDVASMNTLITTATTGNPANAASMKVLVFARWPRQSSGDFDATWNLAYSGTTSAGVAVESKAFFEQLTATMRTQHPGRVFMVPVGHAMYELNQRMKAGQVPGFTHIFQFYDDGIHLKGEGRYLVACAFYATMYGEDPAGLPVPAGYGSISTPVVEAIQDVVWDIVTSNTFSGVVVNRPLEVSNSALPPAIAGQAYSASLGANYGVPPYAWTLQSGTLPAGLSLATNGSLSGTATGLGSFPVTFRVADSGTQTATKTLTVSVENDTVPVVVTGTLPGGWMGTPYQQVLSATSGNGLLTWALASGTLPPGVALAPTGAIGGAPAATGTFAFSVTATDSDLTPDTSAPQALQMIVSGPLPGTLQAPRIDREVKVDGVLNEGFWNFVHSGTVPRGAGTDNTLTFAAVWDDANLYLGARVLDGQVRGDSETPTADDAVHVFIDGLHDRQTVYNADDRHFIADVRGRLLEINGRSSGVEWATTRTAGGYDVEMAIPWRNLDFIPGVHKSVGFDLGVADDDGGGVTGYKVWSGVNPASPAPSQFNSLLLSGSYLAGGTVPGAFVRDPVGYAMGPMANQNGGAGWNGGWRVQLDGPVGYEVAAVFPMTVAGMSTSPQYLIGGTAYLAAGRSISSSGTAVAPFLISGSIGNPGTTVWAAWVQRRDRSSNNVVRFGRSGIPWATSESDTFFEVRADTNWMLRTYVSGTQSADSSVAATVGQTFLMATRMDFGATSGTVRLYINPVPGIEPATAAATLVVPTATARFNAIRWYPGQDPNSGSLDEVRVGPSYAAVVPTVRTAPAVSTALSGTFALGFGQTITLAADFSGSQPLVYQWAKNGTDLPGATGRELLVTNTSAAISGTYSVRASNALGQAVTTGAVLGHSPLVAWRLANGLPMDGSADFLPSAAGDGITNLLKYGLALAVGVPGYGSALAHGQHVEGGNQYLMLTYRRPEPAPAGVSYYVEAGPAPDALTSGGTVVVSSTVSGGTRTVVVRDGTAVGSPGARFIRLRVERTE